MDQPDQRAGGRRSEREPDVPVTGTPPPSGRPRKPARRAILDALPPERPEPNAASRLDPEPPAGVDDPADVVHRHELPAQPSPDEEPAMAHDQSADDGAQDWTEEWSDDCSDDWTEEPEPVAPEPIGHEREPVPSPGPAPLDDLDAPERYRSSEFDDLDDLDEFEEFGPAEPLFSGPRGRRAALVAGAVVVALAGYAVGWSRGSAGLDQGSSPTTLVVGAAPTGAEGAPGDPATTVPAAVDPLALPAVQPTTLAFDDGLPGDVDGRSVASTGSWEAVDGGIAPGNPDPLPADALDPRLVGEGPEVVIDLGRPASLATVKLTTPTPLSGIVGRYQDARNYWAAVVDPTLSHITLYEVLDGVQTPRGFVDVAVVPGITIGLFATDAQIGLVVDGQATVLSTFFGPKAGIEDQGIAGNGVGLITGGGTPAFDDLTYG